MNDQLHTNTVILESYNEFDVNGKKKYVLNTSDGQYDVWETNRDGSQSKAYQDFCSLGELGCQVSITYKIVENGQYVNNVARFMKKVGGNQVKQIDVQAEIAAIKARLDQLENRPARPVESKTAEELVSQFGGTVVSQSDYLEQPPTTTRAKRGAFGRY